MGDHEITRRKAQCPCSFKCISALSHTIAVSSGSFTRVYSVFLNDILLNTKANEDLILVLDPFLTS